MKPTNLSTLGILFLTVLFLAACSGMRSMVKNADKVRIEATPNVLEVHSDSIEVEIRGQIPERYLQRRAHIRFEPTLHYGEQTYPLQEYVVRGEDSDIEADQTVSYSEGGTFTIRDKFPYTPAMRSSNLCMVLNIRKDSDYETLRKCYTTPTDTIAFGTRTSSQTVQQTDDILFAGERSPERHTQPSVIHFEINRAVIRTSEKESEPIQELWNFAKTPELVIGSVNIHAYASPDGPVNLNERLSKNREKNTFDYIKSELLKMGYDEVHDTNFYSQATREDWEGFTRQVQANNNIPQRNWVLQVLNSDRSLEEKEKELKGNNEVWTYLAKHTLPPLRRANIDLTATVAVRDPSVIMNVGDESLDSLNRRELLIYAYGQDDLEKEMAVHEHYANRFPDDWVGHANVGRMHLKNGDVDAAETHLQRAHEIAPDQGVLLNNRGVLHRHKGEYYEAHDLYLEAEQKGVDVNNNMGIVKINMGRYDEAVNHFPADQCDYNVALAHFMNGDNQKALDKIECTVDKTAEAFYLRAVIAARMDNMDLVTTSLTRAIEEDDSFRDRAETDVEFAHYRNRSAFQNALR